MNTNQNPTAVFESRKEGMVTCPYCWTEQRTERDICYHCGAHLVYLDECKTDLGA